MNLKALGQIDSRLSTLGAGYRNLLRTALENGAVDTPSLRSVEYIVRKYNELSDPERKLVLETLSPNGDGEARADG